MNSAILKRPLEFEDTLVGVAWSPDGENLYLATQDGEIINYDPDLNLQTIFSSQGLNVTGLGYYPEDADFMFLYIQHNLGTPLRRSAS